MLVLPVDAALQPTPPAEDLTMAMSKSAQRIAELEQQLAAATQQLEAERAKCASLEKIGVAVAVYTGTLHTQSPYSAPALDARDAMTHALLAHVTKPSWP